ncbi:YdcH family protein [Leptothrix ochracea]|uniref:YdcH family protein n=1 Tax=Leptothrix ochracea TaxID=735331 RepID=UPI0034E2F780
MIIEHHPLSKDFPELRERISALKSHAHFTHLANEYEAVDKSVVRFEQQLEHCSGEELEQLKLRRVHLKDELYALLTAEA